MKITSEKFGITIEGEPVTRYTITDGAYSVSVLDFGGIVQALTVPDRNGNPVDVVLGFEDFASYANQHCYMGAITGRCANRSAGGIAEISGRKYRLTCNEKGRHHLHGGFEGFNRKIWRAAGGAGSADNTAGGAEPCLKLTYVSPDGEEGYPGELSVTAIYSLSEGMLSITYRAVSSKDTICNISNHAYFNLSGQGSGTAANHSVEIDADFYAAADGDSVATGEKLQVEGTDYDFRSRRQIGDRVNYDNHYFCKGEGMRKAAEAFAEDTGIKMTVYTDKPGMQFYTGSFLKGLPAGKNGALYTSRSGFCFETQYPPNAVNCPGFESPILKAGRVYEHTTVYEFTTEQHHIK